MDQVRGIRRRPGFWDGRSFAVGGLIGWDHERDGDFVMEKFIEFIVGCDGHGKFDVINVDVDRFVIIGMDVDRCTWIDRSELSTDVFIRSERFGVGQFVHDVYPMTLEMVCMVVTKLVNSG